MHGIGMTIGRRGRGQNICIFVLVWSQIASILISPWMTGPTRVQTWISARHFLLTSYIFSGARDPRASRDHGAAGRFFTRARDPYAQCIHLLTGACSLCPQRSRPSPAPLPFTRTWRPCMEHRPQWPCSYQNRGRKARRRRLWMKQPEMRSRIRDVPWGFSPSQGPWTGRCFLRQAPDDLQHGRAANRQGNLVVRDEQPGGDLRCVLVKAAWRSICGGSLFIEQKPTAVARLNGALFIWVSGASAFVHGSCMTWSCLAAAI
jgi:hypothetical protein